MSLTTKRNFINVAAVLAVGCLVASAMSGCSSHSLPLHPGALKGKVARQSAIKGPEEDGEKGSIKVVFTGAQTPASLWWVDTAVKPADPELVHPVMKQPGNTVTSFSSGEHILYFSTQKPAIAPKATVVKVGTWKTTVVEVEFCR